MDRTYTDAELEAYLDEQLATELLSDVERALRDDEKLVQRLAEINLRRDAGVHSIGAVWRRHRIGCPTREQLGAYLLGALEESHARYVKFHIESIGCSYCRANLEDLRRQNDEAVETVAARRTRYFQSSVGFVGEAE